MSDALSEIRAAADRLRELGAELRAEDLGDERAAALAREAAEVVSQAGNEIDRALRQADAGDEAESG